LSSGFPVGSFLLCPGKGHTLHAEAPGLRFECLHRGALWQPFRGKAEGFRRRSLMVFSASPVAVVLVLATAPQHIPSCIHWPYGQRPDSPVWTVWHGTVLCDHPARPSSSQSHRRPPGITPDGSIRHLGLSQARRDRDRGHDRCNHYSVVSRLPGTYQRLTHGGSSPNRSHNSKAA